IVSEFLPWISDQNLIEIYIITTSVAIGMSFLYLFPLISGIICVIGNILLIYNEEYRINSVIIIFIGLGFLLLFFFDLIPRLYLSNISLGFYFCLTGFLLSIIDIIIILITKE
ncbi:MAG: hypothetical protein ACFFAN_20245, partial [Promethearchaeota archaeon]